MVRNPGPSLVVEMSCGETWPKAQRIAVHDPGRMRDRVFSRTVPAFQRGTVVHDPDWWMGKALSRTALTGRSCGETWPKAQGIAVHEPGRVRDKALSRTVPAFLCGSYSSATWSANP